MHFEGSYQNIPELPKPDELAKDLSKLSAMTLEEFDTLAREQIASGKSLADVRLSLMRILSSQPMPVRDFIFPSKVLSEWIKSNSQDLHLIVQQECEEELGNLDHTDLERSLPPEKSNPDS